MNVVLERVESAVRCESESSFRSHLLLVYCTLFEDTFLVHSDRRTQIQSLAKSEIMTMDKDTVRFLQIFSARLVLECFGGGGAIWGFSEVITFRNPATQEFWRFNAQVAGFIFFFRWLLQISDYLKKQSRDEASTSRLFQIFSARLVLEVFGGAGAIWYVTRAFWMLCISNRRLLLTHLFHCLILFSMNLLGKQGVFGSSHST